MMVKQLSSGNFLMLFFLLGTENVKALFRRGKAHAAVWNLKEAEADFEKVASLDPSLQAVARKELDLLHQRSREKDILDKDKFKTLF